MTRLSVLCPPLGDDERVYGGDPESVYSSIVEGSPNGMPAWSGKIHPHEIWRIVAYVRSLARLPSSAPGPMAGVQPGDTSVSIPAQAVAGDQGPPGLPVDTGRSPGLALPPDSAG